jgi:hypothetical protein
MASYTLMRQIQQAIITHAKTSGAIQHAQAHPPRKAPAGGVTACVWLGPVTPLRQFSGLSSTAVAAVFQGMLITSDLQKPYEGIDEKLWRALDAFFGRLHGDLSLGGLVNHIDVFGAQGAGALSATGDWMSIDTGDYRIMHMTIPLIIDNFWEQHV